MIVGTTEVARLLKISQSRVRQLLESNRIEGAYKIGKFWAIPLFEGMPIVHKGTRGPRFSWQQKRRPAKTIIHVNGKAIRDNLTNQTNKPVITVKRGKSNIYGHEVTIDGPCRVVYSPLEANRGGARVWIETFASVSVSSQVISA